MKVNTKVLIGSIAVLMMISAIPASAQQDKDAKKAREKMASAQKDLKEAKIDSAADYQKFIKESKMDISENKAEISKLRAKQLGDKKDDQDEYSKKVLALEKTNDELEKRLDGSEHTKTNMWERFKIEFNRDMKKLGEDIKKI
jgi:hypothetical protein